MSVYKRRDSYYIDYYFEGERIRERVGTNKKLAERALAKRKTEIAEGRFFSESTRSNVTFDDLSNDFMKWSKANKRSWERDQRSIRLMSRKFGSLKLTKITPKLIEDYKQERLKSVKGATVNRELACLKSMFSKAVIWDMASSNPVKKVKMLREGPERLRFLVKAEIDALIKECSEDLRPLVIVAVNTGMRYGEIVGMTWDHVDLVNKRIRITRSKSGRSRDIPMNRAVYDLIAKRERVSKFVFCRSDGTKINSVRTAFLRALERAGIEDFRFHDLRHTFASHIVMSGVDLITVMELLGHTTTKMTLRYAHLCDEHRTKSMEKLSFDHGHKTVTNDRQAGSPRLPNSLLYNECRSGGTGRRKGLKIPRSLALCRFDPGLRHHNQDMSERLYRPFTP